MIRVVIRKSLHPFLEKKAEALGISDMGEVVNYVLLQLQDKSLQCTNLSPTQGTAIAPRTDEYSDLSGLLG